MSNDIRNNNSGIINKNRFREKDNQPSHWGRANIDGVQWHISAWTKQNDNGDTYMSLSFQTPEEKAKYSKKNEPEEKSQEFNPDDLPF